MSAGLHSTPWSSAGCSARWTRLAARLLTDFGWTMPASASCVRSTRLCRGWFCCVGSRTTSGTP
eukprot:6540441-Alexandrium_andersonii.AAC.1